MAAVPRYEPHQVEQILSLLHDRRECITLRAVMLELTVSRGVARSILAEVAQSVAQEEEVEGSDTKKYEVVRMVTKTEEGRRRMELVADGHAAGEGSIFSIAPVAKDSSKEEAVDEDDVDEEGNPLARSGNDDQDDRAAALSALGQIVAAHERALALQREKLLEGEVGELYEMFADASIAPAPEVSEENDEGVRVVRRRKRGRERMQLAVGGKGKSTGNKARFGQASSTAATASSTTIGGGKAKKGKPTSAAAFFGSHPTATSKKKKNKKPAPAKKEEEDKPAAESISEKENSDNGKSKHSKAKAAANVDDFVGDVDEDDEFLEEEKARKARVAQEEDGEKSATMKKRSGTKGKAAPKKKKKPKAEEEEEVEDVDMEEAEEEHGSDGETEYDDVMEVGAATKSKKKKKKKAAGAKPGAMDAFATKKESVVKAKAASDNGGKAKKRRKRLVEQTTVDDDGYMKTETVTMWEDVSDDEVEESGAPTKPAASKASARAAPKASCAAGGKGKAKAGAGGGKKKQAGLMGFFAKKK